MWRTLLVATALIVQPALGEDWSLQSAEAVADWSGAYFGAAGGLGLGAGRANLEDYFGVLIPLDVSYGLFPQDIGNSGLGISAGLTAGVNIQSGSFVGGIEGDLGFISSDTRSDYSRIDNVPSSPFPGVSTNTHFETSFGGLGTLRLRGGLALGDTLIFGTAGLAAGHVTNRFGLALPEIGYSSPDWSSSGVRFGYAVGIGVEHQLNSKVSLKFETLYVNLADSSIAGADSATFPGEGMTYGFSNDAVLPRLGLNVRF